MSLEGSLKSGALDFVKEESKNVVNDEQMWPATRQVIYFKTQIEV